VSLSPRRDEAGSSTQLRLALVVSSREQPAWVSWIVRELQQEPDLEVVVIVRPPHAAAHPQPRRYRRWSLSGFLHGLYHHLDRRRIPAGVDPMRTVNLSESLGPDQLLESLADDDRFVSGVFLLDAIPDDYMLARFDVGLLTVRHGGADRAPTATVEREVLAGATVVQAEIRLWRRGSTTSSVIQTSSVPTDQLSVAATARRYLLHLTHSLALRLTVVARSSLTNRTSAMCPPSDAQHRETATPSLDSQPPNFGSPGILRSLTRMAALRLEREFRVRFQQEDWTLAVARSHGRSPLAFDPAEPAQHPTLLLPPPGTIWADPFPMRRNGRTYVFYEELNLDEPMGFISLLELTDDLRVHELGPVLKTPYHLSYPQVFEWQGSLFMLPETEQNRTVELHRCVSWPDRWTLEAVLLSEVSAVDATVFEIGGDWWMFTTMNPHRDVDWNTSLYLFRAPGPLGPWTPHRGNPVKADVRNSRSAGRLFWDAGRLFRPSQDCAERYGHAIVFNQVLKLDGNDFRERETRRIAPGWQRDVVGMHTINQADNLYLFDCRLRRRKGRSYPRLDRRPWH
jgi:hypothetical protein